MKTLIIMLALLFSMGAVADDDYDYDTPTDDGLQITVDTDTGEVKSTYDMDLTDDNTGIKYCNTVNGDTFCY